MAPDFYILNSTTIPNFGFIYGDYYEKNSFVFNGYTFNDWSVWMQYERAR